MVLPEYFSATALYSDLLVRALKTRDNTHGKTVYLPGTSGLKLAILRCENSVLTQSAKTMNRFLPIILLALVSLACSRTVYVPVQRPAQVFVGPHVQRVLLLDRSETERRNLGTIESIITGEIPGLDKEGAQRAMDGLLRNLQDNQRYQVVRADENIKSPSAPGFWPPILSWEEVENLCRKYGTDALLVLETFDSNFIVTNGSREVEQKDREGNVRKSREFYAEGVATVNLGFRLYDPARKVIIDEHLYGHNRKWEAKGTVLQLAIGGLIDQRQAVLEVSHAAGRLYANRISPNWYRANRDFFTKGKGDANFNIGVRRATVNDWSGAMEAWKRSANSSKRKTAGRSYYNLALMYEIQGDLDTALSHAQRAYTDYGVKKARSYSNILRRRIRDAALLD